jgi:hypothetical protein
LRNYDEDELVAKLSQMSKLGMAAFACSCAERSFGALSEFFKRTNPSKIPFARRNMDVLWQAILEEKPLLWSDSITEETLAYAAVTPNQEFPELSAWAEDASAAICYTAFTLKSGDAQNAGWAARRVFDLTFYAAEDQTKSTNLHELDASDVVQRELQRQSRDLDMLLESDEFETYQKLKKLAQLVDIVSELRGGST